MHSNDNQDRALQEELARLKAEHQRLRDEKLRTERDVAHLASQIEELQDRARAEFGTSDVDQLRTLLDQRRAENQAMVAQFREHLQAVQGDLAQVEQRVDAAEDGEAGGR